MIELIQAAKNLLQFREGILLKEYDKLSPTLAGALHDLAMALKADEQNILLSELAIELQIKENSRLLRKIKWLYEYKDIADETLSMLIEKDDSNSLEEIQTLALEALNISAHKQPDQ